MLSFSTTSKYTSTDCTFSGQNFILGEYILCCAVCVCSPGLPTRTPCMCMHPMLHVCTHVANTRASTWLHQRAKHNNNTATTIIGSLQLHKKNARKTTMICMQHKRTQAPSTTDNEKTREKREQIPKRKKREMSRWLVFFLLRGCELIIPYQDTHQIYTTPCFFWAREAGVRHKDVPNSPTGDRFDPCAHRWVKDHGFSGSRGSAPKICSSSRSSLGKVVRSEFLAFGRYTSPPPGGARGEGGNSGCVW